MSVEFDDLYQEIILDHYKHPRNKMALDSQETVIHENPTCGDSLSVKVHLSDVGTISKVVFDGHGCAICMASASIMTEELACIAMDVAKEKIELFLKILRGEVSVDELISFGDAAAFKTVTSFPLRVKCATLAWHAARVELNKIHSHSGLL